ncbi:MAG: hypothetical protein ACOYNL_02520 [Rickettsiales bacterium]
MVVTYTFIICLSSWLVALLLLRVGGKVASVLGNRDMVSAGVVLSAVSIAFLVVVAPPASVMVAAIALIVAQYLTRQNVMAQWTVWGVPLLAAALAVSSLTLPAIGPVPSFGMRFAALGVVFGLVMAAQHLPSSAQKFPCILLACLAPLLLAPLLGAPSYLALDIGIIASALLGVAMVAFADSSYATARAPMLLITGWLIVEAFAHGAWIAAAISITTVLAAIAYGVSKPDITTVPPDAS